MLDQRVDIAELAPIYFDRASGFSELALGVIVQIPGVLEIPNGVLIMFGAALIGAFVLTRTLLGRYTFALGSNEEAAHLSGINVPLVTFGVYIIGGILAALSGLIFLSRLSVGDPNSGLGLELEAITIAVIGGVITSTLLTLLVIPTFYDILASTRDRVGRLFKA